MSSLFLENPTKSYPKGRWTLQYNIYIDGVAKRPMPRIKRTKKSDIPNKVRIAVQDLEAATKTGIASKATIDQWVRGYPELKIKPLIPLEDACRIFQGYRDTLSHTGQYSAVDFDGAVEIYSNERLANQKRGADTDNRSHQVTMAELDRVLRWVKAEHPTLTTLTPDAYFNWWLQLRGKFASSTVNKRNYALRLFLDVCVREGMIPVSPYPDKCPTLQQVDAKERRILDIEEVEGTIERIRQEEEYYLDPVGRKHPMHGCLPIAQMIGLNTGVRTKELRWLEWDCVRLSDRKSSYMNVQQATCKKTKHVGNVKTGQWRTIGINSLLKEWLKKERARQEELNIVGQFITPSGRFDRPNRKKGTIIDESLIGQSMLEFNERENDIYTRPEWPTYYSYRHTFATNLLRSGEDLETVRNRMGHTSIATTQKYLRYIDAQDSTVENNLPWASPS